MKFSTPVTLAELARISGCEPVGDPSFTLTGINEIHRVVPGDITFVDVEKYYAKALGSAATCIIINKVVEAPIGKVLLVAADPFNAYNALTEFFQPRIPVSSAGVPNVHPHARIGRNVVMGDNVFIDAGAEIGHNVVIGNNVTIGDHTIIHANVTILDNCHIGKHCCINSGSVIGGEAFYFKARPYGRDKMLTKGRVIIHDHVDIGANCTIDRGVSDDTIIGECTKLDNLIQIGHDTRIGRRCIIAAQTGIAGVVDIEDDVIIWGQVGINKDLRIGSKAVLMAKTGVMSSLEGGKAYGGMVADDLKSFMRKEAIMRKLVNYWIKIERWLGKID